MDWLATECMSDVVIAVQMPFQCTTMMDGYLSNWQCRSSYLPFSLIIQALYISLPHPSYYLCYTYHYARGILVFTFLITVGILVTMYALVKCQPLQEMVRPPPCQKKRQARTCISVPCYCHDSYVSNPHGIHILHVVAASCMYNKMVIWLTHVLVYLVALFTCTMHSSLQSCRGYVLLYKSHVSYWCLSPSLSCMPIKMPSLPFASNTLSICAANS